MSSDIPDVEFELVMGEVFDVEALGGGDGGDVLSGKGCTSLESDLRMVVLPALSSPRTRILSSSFLFLRRFLRMPMSPPACVDMLNLNQLSNRNPFIVALLLKQIQSAQSKI